MNRPFFSILVPVYKNIEYLDDCLQSILNQDFDSYEVVLCYQGETKPTDIVKDTRVRNIYMEKPSLYLARIESYKEANGEYVLFVDSDDELLEGALSSLHQTIELNAGVDIVQFSYTSSKESTVCTSLKPQKEKLNQDEYLSYFLSELGTYPIWRKCFKHNDVQFYQEDIFMGEDALLSLAFIKRSRAIVSIDNTLYYYRPNAKSGTSNLKTKYLDDLSIFHIYSLPYRKNKAEIEMAIYSYIRTFLTFHFAFPEFDFLTLRNVNIFVDKLLSYSFTTKPRFVKKYFLNIINSNEHSLKDKICVLGLKSIRGIWESFEVYLNDL